MDDLQRMKCHAIFLEDARNALREREMDWRMHMCHCEASVENGIPPCCNEIILALKKAKVLVDVAWEKYFIP